MWCAGNTVRRPSTDGRDHSSQRSGAEGRIAVWVAPAADPGWSHSAQVASLGNRGGRFGAHSANESTAPVFHKKVAFFTWFNGGVRAVDIRNPYQPKEIGYFIPSITEATDKRCIKVDGKDRCKTAIQSNNLETDERGYIYVVDRANTGMHILEVTGAARKAANFTKN